MSQRNAAADAPEPGTPFAEIRSGNLGVRLAMDASEIDAGQALRYRVFYQEMGARGDTDTIRSQRDKDIYDTVADHLLVVDHALGDGPESVVGVYRLIQRGGSSIQFLDIRMVAGIGQHPGDDPALAGHFQASFDAQTLDPRFHSVPCGRSFGAAPADGRPKLSHTTPGWSQGSQGVHARRAPRWAGLTVDRGLWGLRGRKRRRLP